MSSKSFNTRWNKYVRLWIEWMVQICIFIYSRVKEVSKLAIIYMQVETSWRNIEPIYSDIYVKKACSDKN